MRIISIGSAGSAAGQEVLPLPGRTPDGTG